MDIAGDLARQGCPHFTVVIAERQTAGRGRLKRHWLSEQGGLYFTLVIRPQLPINQGYKLNFAASLCLARMLKRMFAVNAQVKWPNDILINEKKITGMLSEMELNDDRISFVNIGIGINVNNDPTSEEPKASSLKNILGRAVSRKELLAEFLDAYEDYLHQDNFDNVISDWKRYTLTLGRQVKIVTTREVSEGCAEDVDDEGALILRLADGSLKKVVYGDCFHSS
jgi:BirA family biotin operon repressor/biotin-[acetyl-CoA-carboxylase] ligase